LLKPNCSYEGPTWKRFPPHEYYCANTPLYGFIPSVEPAER
jgi:hypothetical protein